MTSSTSVLLHTLKYSQHMVPYTTECEQKTDFCITHVKKNLSGNLLSPATPFSYLFSCFVWNCKIL